jgi:hypothetical protein
MLSDRRGCCCVFERKRCGEIIILWEEIWWDDQRYGYYRLRYLYKGPGEVLASKDIGIGKRMGCTPFIICIKRIEFEEGAIPDHSNPLQMGVQSRIM